MERLTSNKEADTMRKAYEKSLAQGYMRNIPHERYLRLAAYEDTGLEPQEIIALRACCILLEGRQCPSCCGCRRPCACLTCNSRQEGRP